MHDLTFKESFADIHNRRQLENLLETFLKLPKGSLKDKLNVSYESQIKKTNINEKSSRTDIVVEFDDTIVDLEAYVYLDEESVRKSTYYVMKLSVSKIVKGMAYENDKKIIQFNFVDNIHTNIGPNIINSFHLTHDEYPEIKIEKDRLDINYVRIDKVRELGYNEDELIKWLRFIAARNFQEREKVAEGDGLFMEFNEWIDTYVNDDVTKEALAKWNQQIEENKQIKIAHEQGLKEGLEKGLKKGIEQKSIEIAKNLLSMNLPLENISKATGLTKEEIMELKENKE